MNWHRFLAAIAVLVTVIIAVGAIGNLTAILPTPRITATVLLLVALVVLVSLIAVITQRRVTNPYW